MAKRNDVKSKNTVERFEPLAGEGLSEGQVASRIAINETNDYAPPVSKSYFGIVAENIFTLFNLINLLLVGLLIIANAPFVQYLPILLTLSNVGFGIGNGVSAKRRLDELTIVSASDVTVVRGGAEKSVPVREIVLDDVVLLAQGCQVPVDCILLSGAVEVNEGMLTGEGAAVSKSAGDKLFGGSFIMSGSCAARADSVGAKTYIARLTEKARRYKKSTSEIMRSTNKFIKIIAIVLAFVGTASFFVSFFALSGNTWSELGNFFNQLSGGGNSVAGQTLQLLCCIVIGVIPVGIMFLGTVSLAEGIIKLHRYDTLVRDMNSMEMLARVNVLCLDKTGTITDGKMTVAECKVIGGTDDDVKVIMSNMLGALDNENSTSIALSKYFGKAYAAPVGAVLPFSSDRKLSAVTFASGKTYAFGAPEAIFGDLPPVVGVFMREYAAQGLRVIALAEENGGGYSPIAMFALAENIRSDAIKTLAWFRENGVEIKIISGDNPLTVSSTAARAGVEGAKRYISLDGLSDEEVALAAGQYTVFGRVSPEQKAILVSALKSDGMTVGMTGDGVNDILAMRRSDCAIAVESGANAAKSVANLVLLKNNFAAMPKVVEQGRQIINNIKDSTSLYMLKTVFVFLTAVFCICTMQAFFFTPSNMITFECFIVGMCSFLMSQQTGRKRVSGKFLRDVTRRALPASIAMFLGIAAVSIMNMLAPTAFLHTAALGGTPDKTLFTEVLIVILTVSGIASLCHLCRPMSVYKYGVAILVLIMCAFVLSVPFAAGWLSFDWRGVIELNGTQWLIIAATLACEFPALIGVEIISDFFFDRADKIDETAGMVVYYDDELRDDFCSVAREPKKIPADFRYTRHKVLFGLFRAIIYRGIMRPALRFYGKFILRQKIYGRELLKAEKGGCYIYANHTNTIGDAMNVCTLPAHKMAYAVAASENLSGVGMETLMLALGALPIPTERGGIREFMRTVEGKAANGSPVYIYPEAHIWPYYTDIRPFTSVSMTYPVKQNLPSYAVTTTYHRRKRSKLPREIIYVDGPFFPNPELSAAAQKQDLRDRIYAAMKERAKTSDYDYIKYRKREKRND